MELGVYRANKRIFEICNIVTISIPVQFYFAALPLDILTLWIANAYRLLIERLFDELVIHRKMQFEESLYNLQRANRL